MEKAKDKSVSLKSKKDFQRKARKEIAKNTESSGTDLKENAQFLKIIAIMLKSYKNRV
jgi:hypothetical protein